MGKYLAVFLGLVAIAAGVVLVWISATFRAAFVNLVLGFIPPVLFFGGLISLVAGISSIKDARRTKKLELETETKKVETTEEKK